MFYGLSRFIKFLLPKRLFYRALIIVAAPTIMLQLIVTIVFYDSIWIKANKNITDKENKINLNSKYYVGNAEINLNKMTIKFNNKTKKINNAEKKVLVEMLVNPGKTYSREEMGKILEISQERSIDVMITRLRQKLENEPKNPKYLQTIRGSGSVSYTHLTLPTTPYV